MDVIGKYGHMLIYDPLMAGSIDGTDEIPHDHGIVRAMNIKYTPNKDVVGKPECTIFVGNLNPETDERSLEIEFSKFGEIVRLRQIRDIVTGVSKGYAFVEYSEREFAYKAEGRAHKMVLDGNELLVDFECERTLPGWIPRRLGGGFGGKKESGQLRFGGKDRPFWNPILVNNNADRDNREQRHQDDKHPSRDARQNDSRGRDRRRDHSRERHRSHSRERHRSHSRERHRDRSRDSRQHKSRHRDSYRDKYRDRSRDRNTRDSQDKSKHRNTSDSQDKSIHRDKRRDERIDKKTEPKDEGGNVLSNEMNSKTVTVKTEQL